MVTMRYHSLIFAAICNKPILALGYAPKVTELTKQMKIPVYKPHKPISIQFSQVSNLDSIRSSAQENFNRLFEMTN